MAYVCSNSFSVKFYYFVFLSKNTQTSFFSESKYIYVSGELANKQTLDLFDGGPLLTGVERPPTFSNSNLDWHCKKKKKKCFLLLKLSIVFLFPTKQKGEIQNGDTF